MLFSHNYLHKSKSSSTFATDFRLCGLLRVLIARCAKDGDGPFVYRLGREIFIL